MFDALIDALSSLDTVDAIALGGSRAGVHFDPASDYDVYVYCSEIPALELRRDILESHCTYMELGNDFWEYEDNCTLKNGIDMDILYRNLPNFTAELARVVEGCHARNGYTTCMWHNLLGCRILYDRNGRLAAAKERFSVPYPEQLRQNIISRNFRLLQASMPAYRLQMQKAVRRRDTVSMNHRLTAFLESYFDILFALNRQTHPGEKRLISLCRETCPVLPEAFEETLEGLFVHLYTQPEAAMADMDTMLLHLRSLLSQAETGVLL